MSSSIEKPGGPVQVPYTGTLFLVPPKVNVIIFGLYQIKSR